MKDFFFLFLCFSFVSVGFASEACNAPQVESIVITSVKNRVEDTQLVYFGGRYSIQVDVPKNVMFNHNTMVYSYSKDKYISFLADDLMTEANKNIYLIAFGLRPNTAQDDEVFYIRKGSEICNGVVSQYRIGSLKEVIVATHNQILNKSNTVVYIFNEVSPFIESVHFVGFTNKEVHSVLSTLKNIVKKD